ncbi:MAG: hypothetical protein H8E27_08835 [Verrucomicrobia subdivision 3 bacterium]|nr:hypothetical protein [Limisphaerales bacterium]
MSLKAFHLIFVIASIFLGLGVGGWGVHEYQSSGEMAPLVIGLAFFAMGIGLFFYGRQMLKKTKDIGYLTLAGIFFLEQNANACAACFGESDAPMAEGMNAGIFTLLIVVGGTLTGIAGFFIFIIRRSMQLANSNLEEDSSTI